MSFTIKRITLLLFLLISSQAYAQVCPVGSACQALGSVINGTNIAGAPSATDRVPVVQGSTTNYAPYQFILNGPTVANTTALRNSCTSYTNCPSGDNIFLNGVTRLTDGTANAPPLYYAIDKNHICTSDDGGYCIKSANTTSSYFIAQFSGAADVREWSANPNGTSNSGPAINACEAAYYSCLIPVSALGFFTSTSIVVPPGHSLLGVIANPGGPPPTAITFAGSSWIICSATATPCVTTSQTTGAQPSTSIRDIVISGVNGVPTAGTIGLRVTSGYNIQLANIYVYNEDICRQLISSGTAPSGLGINEQNPLAGACKSYYFDFNGWPEYRSTNGRIGTNGGHDYVAQAYIRAENNTCSKPGCGPNTISFFGTQFNPGGIAGPACNISVGNITSGYNTLAVVKLIGVHFENTGTSFFCSDNTVPAIGQIYVTNASVYCDAPSCTTNGGADLFAGLDPTTAMNEVYFTADDLVNVSATMTQSVTYTDIFFNSVHFSGTCSISDTGSGTLTEFQFNGGRVDCTQPIFAPTGTGQLNLLYFTGVDLINGLNVNLSSTTGNNSISISGSNLHVASSFTGGSGINRGLLDIIQPGTLTLAGAWSSLSVTGSIDAISNTATGSVLVQSPKLFNATGGGTPSKYVCTDSTNKLIISNTAC